MMSTDVSEKLPIIWIEWGRKVPKYLEHNVQLHNLMFSDVTQYLISDHKPSGSSILARVKHFPLDEIPSSNLLMRFDEISQKRVELYSQKNFWIGTTRRFFLLHDFMQSMGLTQVLHIESDNVMLNLNQLDGLYAAEEWSIAYPMQSESLGCGSVFLIREIGGLRSFLEFVLENWANPKANDMSLLGDFSKNRKIVKILPSWPTSSIAFDPGAYGKYFLGSDARNFRIPTRQRGVITSDKTSLLNCMAQTRIVQNSEANAFSLVVNDQATLMNLHVHSKYIPKKPHQFERFVRRGISAKRGFFWRTGKLDFLVVLERFLSRAFKFRGNPKDIRFR
jgi:hypothetical protein